MRWDVVGSEKNSLGVVFLDLARKAVSLNPSVAKPREVLAHHLLEAGAHEEALGVLTDAAALFPARPKVHLMLADAHRRAGRIDVARQILERAPAVANTDPETALFRLELQLRMGVSEDAFQIATAALALDPTNKEAFQLLGGFLRRFGRLEELIPFCKAALEREPGSTSARYEYAVALATLGRSAEARQLIDLEQFTAIADVATTELRADTQPLEAEVVREITRNATLAKDPVNKAIKGGLQTIDRLPHAGERAIASVLARVRAAIDLYEKELPKNLEHSFVRCKPNRAWLNAWAVVYQGESRQVPHIHADGWLSGVYFVSVPKPLEDNPRGGCLVLGSLEGFDATPPPWGLRDIHPVAGQAVFFPSYIPHSTVPTKSTEPRICISFDVVPVRSKA